MKAIPIMSVEDSKASNALHEPDATWAVDDQSGEELDAALVRLARKEEIAYFKSMKVYEKVSVSECLEETGRGPIAVRWVDINKGDRERPNYRSRLVAKEFKTDDRPEWFAATPPGECLKVLLSRMASNRKFKMLYADVSRAYFYAAAVRPVFVKLPEEDLEEGDEGKCGKLRVSMYGTRDAALNWSLEYSKTLIASGYKQGVANPCLFYHAGKDVSVMVHGDDFAAVGEEKDVAETERILREKYKIKVEKLGGGAGDSKEIRVLNKVLRYTDKGLELEADPRHAELVVKELRLEGSKPSRVPGSKVDMVKVRETKEEGEDEEMNTLEVAPVLVQRVGGKVVAMSKAKTQDQVDWELMAVDQEADEGEEELGPAEAKI